jgi:hypothetical protein
VEGSCEHGNEPSGSIKCWEFLEWLHNWQLLKKSSAPWVSEEVVSFIFVVPEIFPGASLHRRGCVLEQGSDLWKKLCVFVTNISTPSYLVQYGRLGIWNITSAMCSAILVFSHVISYECTLWIWSIIRNHLYITLVTSCSVYFVLPLYCMLH